MQLGTLYYSVGYRQIYTERGIALQVGTLHYSEGYRAIYTERDYGGAVRNLNFILKGIGQCIQRKSKLVTVRNPILLRRG